ncbi:MAG: pyridoxine 5'-phosphate synthase [Planctomycetaceae bacterium]|jgi:pyridoxine 5-phosphate synthase|nr:pyridoxine 5'-phosphate synthase [Planctomycetaceae bacterium]
MLELGVNIDHIATVRQARQTVEPDPVWAAALAEMGGADGITVHLREDRRHIQDRDVNILRETVRCKLNLEMACAEEIIAFACKVRPDQATLVPERREEITTEGGLDAACQCESVAKIVKRLQDRGIVVSLFLDPDPQQIESGIKTGCDAIEIHTGCYALAETEKKRNDEWQRIQQAGTVIYSAGLRLHAGHGLTYHNVLPIASIPNMRELNIGHSIIARAFMVGMKEAVAEMKQLLIRSRTMADSERSAG